MPERLTEEQIDVALAHADSYVASGQLTVGQTTALVLMLTTALRQVREALEHANHMRTVYDAENQESLRLLRLRDSEALIRDLIQQRDAAREQVRALREELAPYADGEVRRFVEESLPDGSILGTCLWCGVWRGSHDAPEEPHLSDCAWVAAHQTLAASE